VAAYSVAISICGIFPGANHGVRDRFDQPGPVQWSRNTVRQIIGVGRYLGLPDQLINGLAAFRIRPSVIGDPGAGLKSPGDPNK